MIKALLKNTRLHCGRSNNDNNVILNVISIILFACYLVQIGLTVGYLLQDAFTAKVKTILLLLFGFDMLIKILLKNYIPINIKPYVAMPIANRDICGLLFLKEFSSIWNLYLIGFYLPFALFYFKHSDTDIMIWLSVANVYIISLIISNGVRIIKSFGRFKIARAVISVASFSVLLYGTIFLITFYCLFEYPVFSLVVLIFFLAFLYFVILKFIRNYIYDCKEDGAMNTKGWVIGSTFWSATTRDAHYLCVSAILRLIRCKKQYSLLPIFLIFIIMAFNIFLIKDIDYFFVQTFLLIFYNGLFCVFYGLGLSEESTYFDSLWTKPIQVFSIIQSKYYMYTAFSTLATFIMVPVFIYKKYSLFVLLASFLFTVGPVYFLLLQSVAFNNLRYDLFETSLFNTRNVPFLMYMFQMLSFGLPILLIAVLDLTFSDTVTCLVMAVTGLMVFLLHKRWIKAISDRFIKSRHGKMVGFRGNDRKGR